MTARAHRIDFDDEPTARLVTLGSLVADPPIVIDEDTPIDEARRLLAEYRVPALAVVGADDNLRGLVTRTDALRAPPGATAGAAMSGFVCALPAYATIEHAASLMTYEGIGQIIVVAADGTLLGMVSALQLVEHFASHET